MKTFFETQTINMINTRFEERKLPGASFALVTSHIAQHWFSGCSREAQNLKLLPSSQRTTMLQLLSKLLIRGSERVQVIPSQIQPLWECKRVFKITSMRPCTPFPGTN